MHFKHVCLYVLSCADIDKLELEIWLTICAILDRATYDVMRQVWLSDESEYDGNNIYKYIYVTMMICM